VTEITISRPGDWDTVVQPKHGLSHRSTTSSRLPGRAIEGTVHYRIAAVVPCPDCGTYMHETFTGYPHGVRWVLDGDRHTKVDCVGREVHS